MLLLHLSSDEITNLDTIGYHAQVVQWIEKYKAVPGIVHLHARYGLQNSWFISCALFSFSFLKTDGLTFINSAVLLWYLLFVISHVNKCFAGKKILHAFLWLILLLFSLWSYTQVRLAATTASPDFIAVLYTWILFYLLLTNKENSANLALIIFLGIFTITIKLSAVLVIILSIYCTIRLLILKKLRSLIIAIVICLVTISSFAYRNIITTGYPFFPLTFPDVANVDWKFDKENAELIQNYITAYARVQSKATVKEIENTVSMAPAEWIPYWWKNQSLADRSIIAIAILSFLFLFFRVKRIIHSGPEIKIALLTALAGIIFWFIKAPDPRFGFGFILALPAIISGCFINFNSNYSELYGKKILTTFALLITAALSSYLVYRTIYFFSPSQFIFPKGIKQVNYKTVKCNEININIPAVIYGCGGTAIPCAYDSCKTFEPRGKKITDGFRAK